MSYYNNSSNITASTPPACSAKEYDASQVKALKTILYSIVMVVACLGNLFIISVVYRNKKMRKTTNIFIANMATSDMFIAVVTIPRLITELYIGEFRWLIHGTLGLITCKLAHVLGDLSFCISILSHTVIAIDRYYAIVHSLRPSPITPSRRKYIIALIWLFSVALICPAVHYIRLANRDDKTYCIMNWDPLPATSQKIYFTIAIFAITFCIPTFILISLYTRLIQSILGKRDVSLLTSQVRQRQKEDIIVLRKVGVLVVLFFFSVTPFISLCMVTLWLWNGIVPCSKTVWKISFAIFFLLVSNSATNPIVCIILNKRYRRHVRKIIPNFLKWRMSKMKLPSFSTSSEKLGKTCNGEEQNVCLTNDITAFNLVENRPQT